MNCKKCIHEMVCPHMKDTDADRCKVYADKDEWLRVGRYKKTYSTNSPRKTIGQIIYEKRKSRGWTIRKLANKIDCCAGTLTSWEVGKAYPNALFLVSLAEVFECSIDEICGLG